MRKKYDGVINGLIELNCEASKYENDFLSSRLGSLNFNIGMKDATFRLEKVVRYLKRELINKCIERDVNAVITFNQFKAGDITFNIMVYNGEEELLTTYLVGGVVDIKLISGGDFE